MKIFIPLVCAVALAFAEPPVGAGYPSARSSHDHSHGHNHEHNHGYDLQRPLSQEYGAPAARSSEAASNDLSTEYGSPSARNGTPKSNPSETYGAPNARSGLSQEYGVPNARSSAQYSSSRSLSTEYGVPNPDSVPSDSYGAHAAKNGLAQEYASPSVRSGIARNPSSQYGAPELRTPSEEYGVPSQRNVGGVPSQNYGPPTSLTSARSNDFQQSHSSPRNIAKSFVSSRSSKVSSQFGGRSLSTNYGVPATRSSSSYFKHSDTLSQTHGVPNHRDLSDSIEVPRGPQHGIPASRAGNQWTNSFTSTNSAVTRSAPSDTYGAPSARNSKPSEQYGVPDQYSNLSSESYSYPRGALDESLNEEPANYDFGYKVEDYESGSDFGHTETRQDNRAEGSYFVVLPDGTKQVVEYEADERGFKPRISVEPADLGRSGGYDDNAADLTRSNDGPY